MATGYFVPVHQGMSFSMKALTAAALELRWSNIMVMLNEVTCAMLWLCYSCGYSCCISQEGGCVMAVHTVS